MTHPTNSYPSAPEGMVEMFTTPRKKEADVVKEILHESGIKYRSREEKRNWAGWRYCIYVPSRSSNRAVKVIDEGLLERDM